MPTSRGDRARGALVVAGQQHRLEPERSGARATAVARRRLEPVGDDEQPGSAVRRPRRPRPCARAPPRRRSAPRGPPSSSTPSLREQRRAPDHHRASVDDRLDAEPGAARRSARRRGAARLRRARTPRSPARSDARSRPRRRRRGAGAQRGRHPSAGTTSSTAHPALGHGAGLVEHDRRDPARPLEHLGAPDEDPELRAAPGADHQRGRRGEAERARARDDQHGDGGGERLRRRRRSASEPAGERREREHDHDRDEDRRDAVDEPLDRRLARLRLGDEPGDLRERRVGADASSRGRRGGPRR